MDLRTREARLMRATIADLTAHLGGRPSATQRALIERAAWLTLHVAQLDAKATDAGGMTEHDSRQYLAWNNSLTRLLRQLGVAGVAARVPTLAELLAQPSARTATPPHSAATHAPPATLPGTVAPSAPAPPPAATAGPARAMLAEAEAA